MQRPTKSRLVRQLRGQVRGVAMTEYTVLVGLVALVSVGAFLALGVALVSNFEARRALILYPSP